MRKSLLTWWDQHQQVTAALLCQHPIMLHPMDPSTKTHDLAKPVYSVRLLSQRSDQNVDFEDGLEAFVVSIVE
jgi:hypothetical protein